MGDISAPDRVLLIIAAFSRHDAALEWGQARAAAEWGSVALQSPAFDFVETDYYEATMGPRLKKTFWAFTPLRDPGEIVDWKLQTNRWELEYAQQAGHAESRPLNLDPGYITPAKLVLASTKDHAHRMYIAQGIYAEVTLSYRHRQWQALDWTFPDYRRPDYQAFFTTCRDYLRSQPLR